MDTSSHRRPASQHLLAICETFTCEISVHYSNNKILPEIWITSTVVCQSRNESINYVENTIYFETGDLKIHFLMIRNIEIPIKYLYTPSYSGKHH